MTRALDDEPWRPTDGVSFYGAQEGLLRDILNDDIMESPRLPL